MLELGPRGVSRPPHDDELGPRGLARPLSDAELQHIVAVVPAKRGRGSIRLCIFILVFPHRVSGGLGGGCAPKGGNPPVSCGFTL
jgi:hypothetical protein